MGQKGDGCLRYQAAQSRRDGQTQNRLTQPIGRDEDNMLDRALYTASSCRTGRNTAPPGDRPFTPAHPEPVFHQAIHPPAPDDYFTHPTPSRPRPAFSHPRVLFPWLKLAKTSSFPMDGLLSLHPPAPSWYFTHPAPSWPRPVLFPWDGLGPGGGFNDRRRPVSSYHRRARASRASRRESSTPLALEHHCQHLPPIAVVVSDIRIFTGSLAPESVAGVPHRGPLRGPRA